ncbi:hypothetical protein [Pyrinomonas methylaliphatogenes]|jgi:hypothetical protein|uniref:Uncharacterized protein n=1 Tax=Pyrinomonas methylaliphatogenes TaxID=454194 RepID=A0A0B6X0N8_9BACT|nr:hypothetical protein [Pyrinomonas methylaliphatogenes]MBX5477733.1 hypothetical protein [Pyrinomonas methylaliphatogenes]CDM67078.1 hypothetical protein PYK22_03127 [Pyrinomonas methylaliphatogenes]
MAYNAQDKTDHEELKRRISDCRARLRRARVMRRRAEERIEARLIKRSIDEELRCENGEMLIAITVLQ